MNTSRVVRDHTIGLRLIGLRVVHVPTGKTRRVVAYAVRRYGAVLQLSQVIKYLGDNIYHVLANDCVIAKEQDR